MHVAASKLKGVHDFRNFAKLDVCNVSNFVREIEEANVIVFEGEIDSEYATYMLEIKGNAFLWHQIRCIMSILFLIGEGKEEVSVIDCLLNIDKEPARPDYSMALDAPLVLHECNFNALNFTAQPKVMWDLTSHFSSLLHQQLIAVARTKNALRSIECMKVRSGDAHNFKLGLLENPYNDKKMKTSDEDKGTSSSSSSSASDISMEVKWLEVLKDLQASNINPPIISQSTCTGSSNGYVKLMNRNRNDSYQQRCSQLTGTKKERLKRHLQLREENKDTEFFSAMRNEGDVTSVNRHSNSS